MENPESIDSISSFSIKEKNVIPDMDGEERVSIVLEHICFDSNREDTIYFSSRISSNLIYSCSNCEQTIKVVKYQTDVKLVSIQSLLDLEI